MAGGEGRLKRHTTKSAAAATGEGGPMKGCSSKRKAASGGQLWRPLKECSSRVKVEEEAAALAVGVGEGKKLRGAKNRMSKSEIRWLLAQKPMAPPARYAALKRSNPQLTPRPEEEVDEAKRRLYVLAKAFYEMEERLPKVQEWVREELKAKGYVEMDDEWVKGKAEVQALIDREWPEIQAKIDAIVLSESETNQGQDADENVYDDSDEEDED
uniref:Uncharacterized protein n=1 Tax=Arundo donax TaxID=35708 RepID=A0A0A9CT35_ARUDO